MRYVDYYQGITPAIEEINFDDSFQVHHESHYDGITERKPEIESY